MVTGNGFPELLQCPICGGMRGHVVVQNTAAADFHHEKDEQHLEPDRHGDQKIAGHDPLGMILDERSPVSSQGLRPAKSHENRCEQGQNSNGSGAARLTQQWRSRGCSSV
jgi:hypothetical protein